MTMAQAYHLLIAAGELRCDDQQHAAVMQLVRLQAELQAIPPRGSLLWRSFGYKSETPHGVYLWGAAGRGKTMLMDLFFDHLEIKRKRRVHFHQFMIDVHAQLRKAREQGDGDPIQIIAARLAEDVRLLAFDELMVTNSADAMILSRLFTAMLAEGVALVATSNRPPEDLYKDGLNREHFLPFIDLITVRTTVLCLNGPTDYRRDRLGDGARWLVPADAVATEKLAAAFFRLTDYPPEDRAHVPTLDLDVGGKRILYVPKALKGVAVFSFKRLCVRAHGAADYLALARHFHSLFIVGIPQMGSEQRNEAARFVSLIDALYDYRVKLLASAAVEPDALYLAGDGVFEFARTASRLQEMQSDGYMALGHGGDGGSHRGGGGSGVTGA